MIQPEIFFIVLIGSGIALLALAIVGLRWILRINQRTFYLKQICEQLMILNNQRRSESEKCDRQSEIVNRQS